MKKTYIASSPRRENSWLREKWLQRTAAEYGALREWFVNAGKQGW